MRNSKIYLRVAGLVCLLMLSMSSVDAQTFNLHTIEPDSIPSGYTLEWHDGLPVAADNLVADADLANAGVYYAVYNRDSCYSAPAPFKIIMADCGNLTNLYASVDTTNKPAGTNLTFHTAKPVSADNFYTGNPNLAPTGTYYVAYYDPAKDCFTMGTPVRVIPNLVCGTKPDFAVTQVNVKVDGDVSTNDEVVDGSTYGTPVANPSNPDTSMPVVATDGTYSFTPSDTGVYVFYIPVCAPDTTIGCVTEKLVITVTDPFSHNNPPVVNPDIAIVDSGSSVTIPILDNDAPGNPGGHLGTPDVSDPPNGTVVVTPDGEVIYTPDPGFIGVDTFVYTVCDTALATDLCRSTTVTVNVNPGPSNLVFAADDFNKIPMNTTATGNVAGNDIDPDGDPIRVTPQDIVIAGKGTFTLDTLGNYSFTPLEDSFGPVNIQYTVCDTAGNCAHATLHILVDPVNVSNPDFNVTHVNTEVNGNVSNNDDVVPGTTYGTPIAGAGNPNPADVPEMLTDGTYTFTPTEVGVYVFEVPVCPPGVTTGCATEMLTITVTDPYTSAGNEPVVNPDIAIVDSGSTVTIPVLDNDNPGNTGGHFGPPTPTDPPNGSVTVTPDGEIIYTPDPGFTGVDTFTYTVCDTTVVPESCGTTTVKITVNPPDAANTIIANDDFVKIVSNTVAEGNVRSNDIDPDGDPISVSPYDTTIAGSGTFSVDSLGNYTFIPESGFYGPVQIPYTVCDTAGNCAHAVLHVLVDPVNVLEHDFAVTKAYEEVTGDMSVNDELVSGSTFGTPVASELNPSTATPVLNSDGTYSFTATVTGIYEFTVPVCGPGQPEPCPTEKLTITVQKQDSTGGFTPFGTEYPPVVNPDGATVKADSTVTINVKSNDAPVFPGGSLDIPTVSTEPLNGTVTVNPDGTIDYTPVPGFTGVDSFVYTVCDTVPPLPACASATVTVHVLPPNAVNSVAAYDDFASTYGTVPATGNVLLNDNDPEGNAMAVTAQSMTTAEGTLVLHTDGSYTFTPAAGFVGNTSFMYTVCDDGVPVACDNATLQIQVDQAPDYTPQVMGENLGYYGSDSLNDYVIAISNINNVRNKSAVRFYIRQSMPYMQISVDSFATSAPYIIPDFPVSNEDWIITKVGDYFTFTLKADKVFKAGTTKYIGIKVKVLTTTPLFQTFSLTSTIVNGSGGDNNKDNNSYNLNIYKN